MSSPRFEVPSGTIDGANTVFTVSRPYGAGTTAVFINGQLMERSLDDGWFETDPQAGIITLKEAPRSIGACPDVVQVFYLDTAPPLPEAQIFKLRGTIKASPRIRSSIGFSQSVRGIVRSGQPLRGVTAERERLRGSIRESCRFRAILRVCGG